MNDITYILKMCINAISVLLAAEIGAYAFANRKDALKGRKRSQFITTGSTRIYTGICWFFIILAIALCFYEMDIYAQYTAPGSSIDPGAPALNGDDLRMLASFEGIAFMYAVNAFLHAISPVLLRSRARSIIFLGFISIPLVFIAPFWMNEVLMVAYLLIAIIFIAMLVNFVALTARKPRQQFLAILAGFIMLLAGFVLQSPLVRTLIVQDEFPASELVILVALILLGYGFITIPSLDEPFPVIFIDELYLTTTDGRIIFKRQFKEKKPDAEMNKDDSDQYFDEFVASSIIGVESLLRELSSTEGAIKTLVHQNKTILMEGGKKIVAVLIARLDLPALREFLVALISDLELEFSPQVLAKNPIPQEVVASFKATADEWVFQQVKNLGIELLKQGAPAETQKPIQGKTTPISKKAKLFYAIYAAAFIAEFFLLFSGMSLDSSAFMKSMVIIMIFSMLPIIFFTMALFMEQGQDSSIRAIITDMGLIHEGIMPGKARIFSKRWYAFMTFVGVILIIPIAFLLYPFEAISMVVLAIFLGKLLSLDVYVFVFFFKNSIGFLRAKVPLYSYQNVAWRLPKKASEHAHARAKSPS